MLSAEFGRTSLGEWWRSSSSSGTTTPMSKPSSTSRSAGGAGSGLAAATTAHPGPRAERKLGRDQSLRGCTGRTATRCRIADPRRRRACLPVGTAVGVQSPHAGLPPPARRSPSGGGLPYVGHETRTVRRRVPAKAELLRQPVTALVTLRQRMHEAFDVPVRTHPVHDRL